MPLITVPPQPFPRIAGWLAISDDCTELEYNVVFRAFHDVGTIERPAGSNRGPRIDAWTKRAGLKPPVYWCAIWAGLVMADAGSLIPKFYPSCDAWLPYLEKKPRPGSAILYGKPGDGRHIGIVTRIEKDGLWTIEGNRGIPGGGNDNTNNGEGVFHGLVKRTDILGFFYPRTT